MADGNARLLWRVRWAVGVFIVGLVLSGVTAIPLETEVRWLSGWQGPGAEWIGRVREGLEVTYRQYPFIGYGTDWLAFGHVAIAIIFVGAWREPVRNRWLFDAGLILCALVIPWALVFGQVRGIPVGWRVIDCSFGVFGAVPLWLGRRWVGEMEERGKMEEGRMKKETGRRLGEIITAYRKWDEPWGFYPWVKEAVSGNPADLELFEEVWREAVDSKHWRWEDLARCCRVAEAAVRARFPELSAAAVNRVVNGASYEWR